MLLHNLSPEVFWGQEARGSRQSLFGKGGRGVVVVVVVEEVGVGREDPPLSSVGPGKYRNKVLRETPDLHVK